MVACMPETKSSSCHEGAQTSPLEDTPPITGVVVSGSFLDLASASDVRLTSVQSTSVESQPASGPGRDSDGCSTNVRSNSIRRVSTGTMSGGVGDRARHVHRSSWTCRGQGPGPRPASPGLARPGRHESGDVDHRPAYAEECLGCSAGQG